MEYDVQANTCSDISSKYHNLRGTFWGKEYVGAPQQPLGFATAMTMSDLVGCLEPDNLHRHPQALLVISFGFVTTLIVKFSFLEQFMGFLHAN